MSREDKKARNTVLIPLVLLVSVLMFLSSCGGTHYLCDAYASIEPIDCENCDEID